MGLNLAVALTWAADVFLSDALDHGGTAFTSWNPTSYGIVRVSVDRFLASYQAAIAANPSASHAAVALQAQLPAPDLAQWAPAHVILSIGALLIVALVAARFSRFRAVLG